MDSTYPVFPTVPRNPHAVASPGRGKGGAHAPPVIGLAPPVPPQDFMTMYTSMYLNCESCEMHLKRAINFHDNTQLSYTA